MTTLPPDPSRPSVTTDAAASPRGLEPAPSQRAAEVPAADASSTSARIDATRDPPPRASPPGTLTPEPPPPPGRSSNFIVSHWRGELPLAVSYWVIGLGGTLFSQFVLFAIDRWLPLAPLRAEHALAVEFAASWSLTLAITVWQVVGTWRAATRYIGARRAEGRRGGWGTVAKAVLVVGCIATAGTIVRSAIPQALETYEIAFLGDPTIPPYGVRVMRDGTEAEFFGGIRIGATQALRAVLDRNPRVHVLHIDSGGGRFVEAERMADLIRARRLSTYVSGTCASACTLVFPAGRERWLGSKAQLGFHAPDFGVFDTRLQAQGLAQWREALLAAGYRPAFVDRGLAVPFSEMWYPTREQLARSGITFRDANGSQFAMSGYGGSMSRTDLVTLGDDIPAYAVLRKKAPAAFDAAADTIIAAFEAGRTSRQLPGILRAALGPAVVTSAPDADTDALIAYSLTSTAALEDIRSVATGLCYIAATGGDFDVAGTRYVEEDTRAMEWAMIEQVLASAAPRPAVPAPVLAAAVGRLEARLAETIDPQGLALLSGPTVDSGVEDEYCAAVIALGRTIGALAPTDAEAILRRLTAARRDGKPADALPPAVRRHFLVE